MNKKKHLDQEIASEISVLEINETKQKRKNINKLHRGLLIYNTFLIISIVLFSILIFSLYTQIKDYQRVYIIFNMLLIFGFLCLVFALFSLLYFRYNNNIKIKTSDRGLIDISLYITLFFATIHNFILTYINQSYLMIEKITIFVSLELILLIFSSLLIYINHKNIK